MSAITPGEWEAVAWACHAKTTIKCGDVVIAECSGHGRYADESVAEAQLIAAAPNLLAALVGVLRVADRATDEFDAARAAISKATGGQA